jgi:DNA-directed RNA polymerase subunit RPC12/RpoP
MSIKPAGQEQGKPLFEIACPHCGKKMVVMVSVGQIQIMAQLGVPKQGAPIGKAGAVEDTRIPKFQPRTVA